MDYTNEVRAILQNVVSELYSAERFFRVFMLKAQRLGLQGEKRRLRCESVELHNLGNYFPCDFFDLYGTELPVIFNEPTVPTVSGVSDLFNRTLIYFETLHSKLHSAANALVPLNGYHYVTVLLNKCDCITKTIKDYRRILLEGERAAWSDAYMQRLMLHETTWENIHDEFEEKEKQVGYKF